MNSQPTCVYFFVIRVWSKYSTILLHTFFEIFMQPKWVRVIFLTVNFYCYSKIKWMRMCSIIIEQAKVFLLLSVRVSTPYIAIVSFCNLEMVYQIRNRGDKSKKKQTTPFSFSHFERHMFAMENFPIWNAP